MGIEEQISRYLDGDLSPEAESELHHVLAVSPEARALFRAQIALKAFARTQVELEVPTPTMRSDLFGRLQREEGMKALPVGYEAFAAPVARSIPSQRIRSASSRRRRRLLPLLVLLVVGIVAGGVLFNPLGREPGHKTMTSLKSSGAASHVPDTHAGDLAESASQAPAPAAESRASVSSDAGTIAQESRVVRHRAHAEGLLSNVQTDEHAEIRGGGAMARSEGGAANFSASPMMLNRASDALVSADGAGGPSVDSDAPRQEASAPVTLSAKSKSGVHSAAEAPVPLGSGGSQENGNDRAMALSAPAAKPALADSVLGSGTSVPPAAAMKSRKESEFGLQHDAGESNALDPSIRRPSFDLFAGVRQDVLSGLTDRSIHLQTIFSVGIGSTQGWGELYGMIGLYRVRMATETATFNPESMSATVRSILDTSSSEEVWAGIGYRILPVQLTPNSRWRFGVGAWAGYGATYFRGGMELPVRYGFRRSGFSLDITPTLQYMQSHHVDLTTTTLSGAYEVVKKETPQPFSQFLPGLGLGLTYTFR